MPFHLLGPVKIPSDPVVFCTGSTTSTAVAENGAQYSLSLTGANAMDRHPEPGLFTRVSVVTSVVIPTGSTTSTESTECGAAYLSKSTQQCQAVHTGRATPSNWSHNDGRT
eukprot:m.12655 g.12655  ORF g.12655 m.12655 type:complete len:111 (-) comp4567_c0_seq2:639-971(-)